MYNSVLPASGAGVVAGAGAGALAFTGSNSLWLALSAFALIAAGTAILRVIPKKGV